MDDNKSTAFVNYIINVVNENKGYAARMRKADNDATEYQAWDILANWVDLEKINERKAYSLIGASLARAKTSRDGNLSLGEALRMIHYKDNPSLEIEKSSTALRFRRILACKDQEELLNLLRVTLRYVESKDLVINYCQLLNEILWFNSEKSRDWTRSKWAKHFFKKGEES